jgi:hypothetical protein
MVKTPEIPQAELGKILVGRPHVVLLGAGASRAAFPQGDKNGRKLPLMCDLSEMLGLDCILKRSGIDSAGRNFEDIYSDLCMMPEHKNTRDEIENEIRNYFAAMALPEASTLYDHLVLSLREKDVIATFNWDPFLLQACARNARFAKPPRIIFLHGNVAVGYCLSDRIKGPIDRRCSKCGHSFTPSRLLYPIKQKNYASDPFISSEWRGLQSALRNAYLFTIFGYSAPASDVEAIALLKEGWGEREQRALEQVEIVDIKAEDVLREAWDAFIVEHHYDTENSLYDSWLARHPRRSCDAVWRQTMEIEFLTDNPIPQHLPFGQQLAWYKELMDAERDAGKSVKDERGSP